MESLKRIVEEEKIQISQRGLLSIARESEGSMRDAQSLLDQVISYAGKNIRDEDIAEVLGLIDRKILYDTIEAIAGKDAERCMEIVEQFITLDTTSSISAESFSNIFATSSSSKSVSIPKG